MTHLKDVKKIEQPHVKKKQTNKQKQATQKKWGRVSVSLKVLYSNDGH